MTHLANKPQSEPGDKHGTRTLTRHFVIQGYIIPAGFTWDGASIPKAFWSIIGGPFSGKYGHAAILHDFLYRYRGHPEKGTSRTRANTDKLFRNVMRSDGVSRWRYTAMYRAVRMFGAGAWRRGKPA